MSDRDWQALYGFAVVSLNAALAAHIYKAWKAYQLYLKVEPVVKSAREVWRSYWED